MAAEKDKDAKEASRRAFLFARYVFSASLAPVPKSSLAPAARAALSVAERDWCDFLAERFQEQSAEFKRERRRLGLAAIQEWAQGEVAREMKKGVWEERALNRDRARFDLEAWALARKKEKALEMMGEEVRKAFDLSEKANEGKTSALGALHWLAKNRQKSALAVFGEDLIARAEEHELVRSLKKSKPQGQSPRQKL